MKSDDALLNAWAGTLLRKAGAPAIFDTGGEVTRTFGRIESDSQKFARDLEAFSAGEVIAIQIGNHPDWPALWLACRRRGLVVLPLEQSIGDGEREVALEICHVRAVVSAGPSRTGNPEIAPMKTSAAATASDWQGHPPALLKLTSGTTAAPRAIRFQSEQLIADCNQICATMGIEEADVNFAVIPVSHSYGFSNLIMPLLVRGVAMVLSRDRLPRAVLSDIARTGATVFPGMPVFYQAFCEMEGLPELSKLRLCISAGAPLTASLARAFRDKFGRTIHSFYGSSECGGICYDRDGTVFEDGFVGTPMIGVEVTFIESSAEASQVEVGSAAVGDGYFPESDPNKLGHGIFRPDDLVARHAAGYKIVGRVSDLINVAGKKVNPAQVEAQLLKFGGVRAAVAFGRRSPQRNEEVAACVVLDRNVAEQELLEFCRGGLSGWQVPKRIFFVEAIPVNERGKISRRELAKRFAA